MRGDFFFFFNAETSAEYFSFCCFPHKPISLGERWEWKSCCLGCWFLCILYKTYVNVSPFGLGFAFSPWLKPRGEASGQAALTLPGTCRDPSHSVWAGCCQDQTSWGGGVGAGGGGNSWKGRSITSFSSGVFTPCCNI